MPTRKLRLKRQVGALRMRSRDHLIRLRETKLKNIGVSSYPSLLAIPILLALILIVGWLRLPNTQRVSFRPSEEVFVSPYAGWAVRADTWGEDDRLDVSLVYAEATWAELEPEKGVIDFEGFEARSHLNEWWADGKKLILRIVTDRPGEAGHKDIPEWLIEEMGGELFAGSWYESSSGSGFAPDYSSLAMREAHRQLIQALGERYDSHPGVAYIELGSLGWNGEWTVALDEEGVDALPTSTISREYAWHYTSSFPNTLMLMRRPYKEAELLDVGLYNPDLGDFEATWSHLDMTHEGGYDLQIQTDLIAMPDFHLLSPSGAHVPDELDLEHLLMDGHAEFARQIAESHLNYAVLEQSTAGLSDQAIERLTALDPLLGQNLWLRSAQWDTEMKSDFRSKVMLRIRNDGAVPMHAEWPVALALFDDEEMLCLQITGLDTSMLLPGDSDLTAWIDIPAGTAVGLYTLKLAVLDPATNQPGLRLSMKECDPNTLWTILGELRVTE